MAPQDPQAEQAAFSQQYDAQQAQQKAQESTAAEPPSLLQRWGAPVVHATMSVLDSAMSEAEQWGTAAKRVGQDVAAGTATAAANTMDAVKAAGSPDDPGDPANAPSPIWDHAKGAILDFRDAVAVKDPNIIDGLTQSVAQLAIPFMGYSRVLSGLHGIASIVAAGAATDSTALGPHDMRMADMMALGRHTEGKFGDALRTLAPDGSALNAYITYLGDRTNETEAEGRWKNVLDGFGVNMIATPLLAVAGTVLKQGTAGLRYAAENGVRNTVSDLFAAGPVAGSPESQAGKIVFHGTASDFDQFSDHAIGTGEGNQTFGHGHYFAESPETAGTYQQMAARRGGAAGVLMDSAAAAVKKAGGRAQAYTQISKDLSQEKDPAVRADLQKQMQLIRSGNYDRGSGKLLHVDIPDEHIDNMIHWDKPISEQPNLQKALGNLDVKVVPEDGKFRVTVNGKNGPLYLDRHAALSDTDLLRGEGAGEVNAGVVYDQLTGALGGQKAASQFLSRRGVTGIKYLDQGSRDAGKGTHNLVLFNPKHATIVKKE